MTLLARFRAALEFNTRLPLPPLAHYDEQTLPRALAFFPVAGLVIGAAAALVHRLLAPHLSRPVAATFTVAFLVLLTGALHEDGLADCADAFGGGWTREKVLLLLRDSRIGAYAGVALALALFARIALLASLPLDRVPQTLIAAHILCRWSTLPLSCFLPPARPPADGQGARIASLTSPATLAGGTLFAFTAAALLLHWRALPAILLACSVTLLSGLYYRHRIGGVTGDCFGATNQLTEMATYLAGAWTL